MDTFCPGSSTHIISTQDDLCLFHLLGVRDASPIYVYSQTDVTAEWKQKMAKQDRQQTYPLVLDQEMDVLDTAAYAVASKADDQGSLAQGVLGTTILAPQLAPKLFTKAKRHLEFRNKLPKRANNEAEVTELLGEGWDPFAHGKSNNML